LSVGHLSGPTVATTCCCALCQYGIVRLSNRSPRFVVRNARRRRSVALTVATKPRWMSGLRFLDNDVRSMPSSLPSAVNVNPNPR
jgi:hypothetical protein